VVGDVETIAGAEDVAAQVNGLVHFDALIHNAAVGYRESHVGRAPQFGDAQPGAGYQFRNVPHAGLRLSNDHAGRKRSLAPALVACAACNH
jgi:hypothetical protein